MTVSDGVSPSPEEGGGAEPVRRSFKSAIDLGHFSFLLCSSLFTTNGSKYKKQTEMQ